MTDTVPLAEHKARINDAIRLLHDQDVALDVAYLELAEIKRRARDLCEAIDVSTMVGACDFGAQRVLLEQLCAESPMSDAAVEDVVAALKRAEVVVPAPAPEESAK